RTFDLEFPLYRSTIADHLAGGRGARDAGLHADGHAGDAADNLRLHDFRILDFQRKAARGRRISLRPAQSSPRPVGWSPKGASRCLEQEPNQSIISSSNLVIRSIRKYNLSDRSKDPSSW